MDVFALWMQYPIALFFNIGYVLNIYFLYDVFTREDFSRDWYRYVWLVILLAGGSVGSILYLLLVKRKDWF